MCGIAGFLSRHGDAEASMTSALRRMTDAIEHRGPDSSGAFVDAGHGVALGHRRLAIVDLSPQGHQPMRSADGRYTIIFNGEIYNHLRLRERLSGTAWRGHSDTETILAAIVAWGFEATLRELVGMFAIAVWDADEACLLLARDRLGEKPLYLGHLESGDVVFGSELKALCAHPRWQGEIDRASLALYLRFSNVPGEASIYRGVTKLQPGTWATVRRDGSIVRRVYWSLPNVATAATPIVRSDAGVTDDLEQLLSDVIGGQMMADVPLGAFLSGGVDSSTIVALMQRQSQRPVKTFSIGFSQAGFDEAGHAREVARHLRTEHTELYVSAQDALDVIPRLPRIYDEPFADSSQIPTFLVAQMARQHVTVALSGDGGDELFLGYNRYLLADRIWRWLKPVPQRVRQGIAAGALRVPPDVWGRGGGLVPPLRRIGNVGDKVHKFASRVLGAASQDDMYRSLVSHFPNPASVIPGAREPETLMSPGRLPRLPDAVEQMAMMDQVTYLPDDILVKVDRAAMAVSLETRVPLLDHRIVEFAWRLPRHQKLRGGVTKWVLREVLYRHVPRALIERPKQGFAIPLDHWLRGPLKDWAAALLAPQRLREAGHFDEVLISRMWQEHQSGTRNWQSQLWIILMFEAWRDAR